MWKDNLLQPDFCVLDKGTVGHFCPCSSAKCIKKAAEYRSYVEKGSKMFLGIKKVYRRSK